VERISILRRPAAGRHGRGLARCLAFLTSSFVFIDILALFPEFRVDGVGAVRDPPLLYIDRALAIDVPTGDPRIVLDFQFDDILIDRLPDFLTVIEGRNHRQELQKKTEEDLPA
jgi:hypothetical protein